MSHAIAQQALTLWGLEGATLTLVAQRENIVYRVYDSVTEQSWALRIHRIRLRKKEEIISESQWMQMLDEASLSVPTPVKTLKGNLCEQIDGQWVDLQVWLDGDTLSEHPTEHSYRALGNSMARLHNASDNWSPPAGFKRVAWDREGLVGHTPVWGPFWHNPSLNDQQRLLCDRFRRAAGAELLKRETNLDYGLIHADLVTDNVLVDGNLLHLIDFDDCGYGYRLFDLATVILRLQREPEQTALTKALIEGYWAARPLDLKALDLFISLRACTYVGWIIPRINEPSGTERCDRFIKTACAYVEKWLQTHSTPNTSRNLTKPSKKEQS